MKIKELAERGGVTKRTVHYYIHMGLLPKALGTGVNSYYTEEHLRRLEVIRELQKNYLPLEAIREKLEMHTLSELQELVASGKTQEVRVGEKPERVPLDIGESCREKEERVYCRIELGFGIELHYPKELEEAGYRLLVAVKNAVKH